jgi:peptidyl-prolyl cis-trans isomerase SurA
MIPILLLLLMLLPLSAQAKPEAENSQLLDRVVAVVNDEPITQSEMDMILRPVFEDYKKEYTSESALIRAVNEARQKILNQLVEDRLAFQEAKNLKIEADETAIDAQMEEFKNKFKTEEALEEALKKEGLSLTDMRERLRRQWLIRRLQDIEVRSKVVVSPLEVADYFKDHPDEFSENERIKVRSITIKKNEEARQKGLTDEAAKAKAQDLRKKILSGEDFGELAKENSEDVHAKNEGLGDWIERGSMIPAIDEVIFKMKAGEISQIIETSMGYHLFRVEERKEGQKKTLEQARDEIFAKLYEQKARKRFEEWMEELKRNAYISIR